jgi:predicted transcriptional regulator
MHLASEHNQELLDFTADIVSAFVGNNAVRADDLPNIIATVHASLQSIGQPKPEASPAPVLTPAVPIKKSVTEDYLVCLDDGKKFKSLKRHLQTAYGMTPDDYRAKWGLPRDYPMVAPRYAAQRSALAKASGLGSLRTQVAAIEAPAPEPVAPAPANDSVSAPEPVLAAPPKRVRKAAAKQASAPAEPELVVDAPTKRRGRPKKAA